MKAQRQGWWMKMRKWPIRIIVVKILIWIDHKREEFQNDIGEGDG